MATITLYKDGGVKFIDEESSLIETLLDNGWTDVDPNAPKRAGGRPKKEADDE